MTKTNDNENALPAIIVHRYAIDFFLRSCIRTINAVHTMCYIKHLVEIHAEIHINFIMFETV